MTISLVDTLRSLRGSLSAAMTPPGVVFHHVPKCGGTSVGRALRLRYLLSQATVLPEESFRAFEAFTGRQDREQMLIDVLALREQMMLYLLYSDVRCVSLHVPFSPVAYERFSASYKFVTILREPVSRFISHYFWSHGKPGAHAHIAEDFERFLDSERARRLGATYVEYFCGHPERAEVTSSAATERAIANLGRFAVVGRLDKLTDFAAGLRNEIGVRVRIGHENQGRQSSEERRAIVEAAGMDRLRELCAPDIAVWNATAGTTAP